MTGLAGPDQAAPAVDLDREAEMGAVDDVTQLGLLAQGQMIEALLDVGGVPDGGWEGKEE